MIGSEPRGARRRLPAAVLTLALVQGATAVAGNAVAEQRELDRLIASVYDAQDSIAYSNHLVAATVDYTLPLLFSYRTPQRVRDGLQRLVQDAAAGQVASIAAARDRTGQQPVLPWHRDLRRARAALGVYLAARVAFLRAVAANSHALYVVHPDLDRLLDAARDAFRRAAGPVHRSRVDAAFAGGTHPA